MPADPVLRLAQQQKQQLSDREAAQAQQISDAFQSLVIGPIGDQIAAFIDRYAHALDQVRSGSSDNDDGDNDDASDDDIGGFGTASPGAPTGSGNGSGSGVGDARFAGGPRGFGGRGSGGGGGAQFAGGARRGGDAVPASWLLDAHGGNLHGFLRNAKGQIGQFAQQAQAIIAQGAQKASAQGLTDGQALLGIAFQPLVNATGGEINPDDLLASGVTAARKDARFGLLNTLMGDGSQLAQLLGALPQETADSLYRNLLYGLGHGENPRALVSDIQQILDSSRSRALTISRTEMMGAYRNAQLDNFRANSDVLQGWVWVANLGSACPMCTDLNGETFPLDEDMASHPNCGCTACPLTKSWDDILGPLGIDANELGIEDTTLHVESGSDWFARQDEATQRAVLGPSAFNAYQQGDLKLSDLVGRRDDGSFYQKSMKEAGLDYRDYLSPSAARSPTSA